MNQQKMRALPIERKDIKYINKLRHEQSIDGALLRRLGLFGYMTALVCMGGLMGFVVGLVIASIK